MRFEGYGRRAIDGILGNVVPFVDEMPAVHNTRGEEVKPDPNGPTSIYFSRLALNRTSVMYNISK